MGERTPLYEQHEAAGARIVSFHGWDMPLHYGSQIAEHKAVRERAGVFDVSHMTVVDVAGPGARDYLRRLLSNDVDRLGDPGRALYTTMLNESGGIIDDLIVYRRPDGYRLIVNCGTREGDLAWMDAQRVGFDVVLEELPGLAILAVQGPRSQATLSSVLAGTGRQPDLASLATFAALDMGSAMIARTGYTGEQGFEVVLPGTEAPALWEALVAAGVQPAGLGARDTLRLEAGLNLHGNDMDTSVTPYESGISFAVSLKARDFIGRDALVSQREAGVPQKLVGLLLQGKGVIRDGMQIKVGGEAAGVVTSGAFSPSLGRSIALARFASRSLARANGQAEVSLRGRDMPVEIVKPPFVRNNTRAHRPL